MPRLDGNVRLKKHREKLGLSARKAAGQLHVTHVAYLDWESGSRVPSPPFRTAIERWSGGTVPESSWPIGERERRLASKADAVVTGTPAGTGTDGK